MFNFVMTLTTVHPHARGEVAYRKSTGSRLSGSPPRTWGSRPPGPCRVACTRFTPTHVGKSTSSTSQTMPFAVHPHARGEVNGRESARRLEHGSPPRTSARRHDRLPI